MDLPGFDMRLLVHEVGFAERHLDAGLVVLRIKRRRLVRVKGRGSLTLQSADRDREAAYMGILGSQLFSQHLRDNTEAAGTLVFGWGGAELTVGHVALAATQDLVRLLAHLIDLGV